MTKYTLHLTNKHVALPPEREFAYRHSLSLLANLLVSPTTAEATTQTENENGAEVHTPSITFQRAA